MLPTTIRQLAASPVVRGIARRLHATRFARRLYCQLLSASGVLKISCLGVDAVFKTRNSKQLSLIDFIFTTERDTIEATLCDLKPGDTFLDVGCNYGIYSVLASKLVGPAGRVVAVEPHPESVEVLRENLALNGCKNVEILDLAFSDTTGPIALAFHKNFAVPQHASDPDSEVHTARGMAGDEALFGTAVPAGVKIDVEGHEFAVLRGLHRTLSSAACRRLCLEIHPRMLPPSISTDVIMASLQDFGFTSVSENARAAEVHVLATR